ncbi:MAG: ABC transporter permease [Anaerolineae bacterium]|nr:ABC transporter permease [Anaerolineae bacterium]NUQ06772.1 ABC transporter permease [Anaerolineae bacterium]
MNKYIRRRLLQAIPTFFGITLVTFLLMLSAPGDPIALITFNPQTSNTETAARLRRQLGLDQPIMTQYLYWLVGNDWTLVDSDGDGTADSPGTRRGLLRGDLGDSLKHRRPVADLLLERVLATLQLAVAALILGYGAGILLGVLAAIYHKTIIDQIIRVITVIGNAVPQFWLGLLLIIVFSIQLDWLPMSGMRSISSRGEVDLWESVRHMILPVFVLSLNTIAFISRFTRTGLLEVLEMDFIRTARAKGLRNRAVWWNHATRNALLPVATFLGPALGTLLAGAVIVEQVFSWPGMGQLVVNAVFQRDYPLVMGSVVIASVMFILGVLISDILYDLLDPRIQFQ